MRGMAIPAGRLSWFSPVEAAVGSAGLRRPAVGRAPRWDADGWGQWRWFPVVGWGWEGVFVCGPGFFAAVKGGDFAVAGSGVAMTIGVAGVSVGRVWRVLAGCRWEGLV